MKTKKILALLLAAILIFSCFSAAMISSSAAETDEKMFSLTNVGERWPTGYVRVNYKADATYQFEPGHEYELTMKYRNTREDFTIFRNMIWVGYRKADGSTYWIPKAEISLEEYNSISYEYKVKFTVPATVELHPEGNIALGMGDLNWAYDGVGKDWSLYFNNVKLFDVTDNNTEIPCFTDFTKEENVLYEPDSYDSKWHVPSDFFPEYMVKVTDEAGMLTFDGYNAVNVENTLGSITTFATVQSNQTYVFSFDSIYSNQEQAVPYIEAITTTGTQKITPVSCSYEVNGTNLTTVVFKTPANLVSSKNIRIGIDIKNKEFKGTFSNFSLNLADKFTLPSGDNLIADPKFEANTTLADYSSNAEAGVWMKDGEFDTEPTIVLTARKVFKVAKPYLLMAAGTNTSDWPPATKGKGYTLSQLVAATKNKTYRISYNAKWVQNGYFESDKAGIEIKYKKGSLWRTVTLAEVPVADEYKEVYTFTVPNDIANSNENLNVIFNLSSAFTSGYFSNFSLVEIDTDGNAISDELLVNGNFNNGNMEGWTEDGTLFKKSLHEIPENFFSKTKEYNKGMVKYKSNSDWYSIFSEVMIKPDTNYEFYHSQNHMDVASDNPPQYGVTTWYLTEQQRTDDEGNLLFKDSDGNTVYEAVKEGTEDIYYYMGYGDEKTEMFKKGDQEVTPYNKELYVSGNFSVNLEIPELNQSLGVEGDTTKYEYIRRFRTPSNIEVHGNNNIIFRLYMMTGNNGYIGECGIFEIDDQGNRVSDNLILNGDWTFGQANWSFGSGGKATVVEQPSKDFVKNAHLDPAKMIKSNGTGKDATYVGEVTVDAYKEYTYRGNYVAMNGVGVKPEVLYQSREADGAFVAIPVELSYDSDIFEFEIKFTIPEDAVIKDGKTTIRAQINNTEFGKAYIANLMLSESDKYVNIIPSYASATANYEVLNYDGSMFVFHYSDEKFEDGDWSNELGDAAAAAQAGEISGKLTDSSGAPLANVKIQLTPGNKTVKTDANGEYKFTMVQAGTYTITLVEESGAKLTIYKDLEVAGGMVSIVPSATYLSPDEIQVPVEDEQPEEEEPWGALRGKLYDAKGNLVPNAKVYIRGMGYAVTDENGTFEFAKLPVGEYDVYEVLEDGTESVFRTVKIEAYKGSSIAISREGDAFNWLIVIIPVAAVLVLVVIGAVVIIILNKKKK